MKQKNNTSSSKKRQKNKDTMKGQNPSLLFKRAGIIFTLFIVFLVFSPVLKNGFISLDDGKFIYNNEMIRSLDGAHIKDFFTYKFQMPYYKPLVYISWAIDYQLGGNNPHIFHTTNLILHLLSTFLLILILIKGLKPFFKDAKMLYLLSFMLALLWAVHPMKVESVAWVTERKDMLFGFFFFASLYTYMLFREKGNYLILICSALLYAFGLLSKSMIIVLPFVLFVIDYLQRTGKPLLKLIIEKIPYFVLLLIALYVYGLFKGFDVYTAGITSGIGGESAKVDDHTFFTGMVLLKKVIFMSYRLSEWFFSLLWPAKLALIYPTPAFLESTNIPFSLYLYPLFLLILFVLAFFFRKRNHLVLGGYILFLVAMSPVLGMRGHETSMVNDRYTYIGSIGFLLMISGFAWALLKSFKNRNVLLAVTALVIILIYASGTYRQSKSWKDSYTMWNHVVKTYPGLAQGYFFRGNTFFRAGQFPRAIRDYDKAISLDNENAEYFHNRGSAYDRSGNFAEAIKNFNKAIEIHPDYAAAYLDRGGARMKLKKRDFKAAINDFSKVIDLRPSYPDAYYRRAVVYRMQGLHKEAIEDLGVYLSYVNNNERAYVYRADSYHQSGMTEMACPDWQKAASLGNKQAESLYERYCTN